MSSFVRSRRSNQGSHRASRFPWAEAVPGALLGLVIGAAAAITLGRPLAGVTTSPVPFPDSWTYRFTSPSLLTTAVIGGVVAALGFVWRADRQFFNYLLIGCGAGCLLLGTSWLALEKVEVAPHGFAHRSWWGLSRVEYKFAELQRLRSVHHHRAWGRHRHWESLYYQMHDGREGTLCDDTKRSRAFFWAKIHLLQTAGKRGVEVTNENDDGK